MRRSIQVIDITSIAILKSALLADMGATLLPAAPLQDELARGALRASRISDVQLARTVSLCASNTIPLTNAALAVQQLVIEVTRALCLEQHWQGARSLLA
ncbi:LysR substrate-binding domain-containing protein [Undibacterium sp. CCC3.4]|uniref:LysR substrate-binding domain-containing protein n=1 Tax=Undibacterium sp. CCC3.4 TaxID=3048609 RepID=UPI002AC9B697|nr:LysR substrate-binding domain-containing protein [Undibacterium sp. CCC3.4]WPX44645.1 LysR substrate-binding domain-containing protein [Undibacterium sp. CCC3.4]